MTTTAQGFPTNGASMRAFRFLHNLSQAAVAREAGISAGYYSQLERGDRLAAKMWVITAIAAVFRVDPRAIMAVPGPAASSNTEQVTPGRVA